MKKRSRKPVRTTPLAKEHNLLVFTEQAPARYRYDVVKYDGSRQMLIASNGWLAVVVPLQGGPDDMMIAARAIADAMREDGETIVKRDGEKITVESLGGRTIRDAGPQNLKWPSLQKAFALDLDKAQVVSFNPSLLKAIAEYAIACGEEKIDFAMIVDNDGDVSTALLWQAGRATGIVMPRGDRENPGWAKRSLAKMKTWLAAFTGKKRVPAKKGKKP